MDNQEDLDRLAELVLAKLLERLNPQQSLGFQDPPRPRYIYANRSQPNCNWYMLDADRVPVPIKQNCLIGYITDLTFDKVERRGKETWKMHLHVRADRPYIIEAGYDANFSKSVLSCIAIMSPEQLSAPIGIEVQAADQSDEVLFCRIYSGGEAVFAPWTEETAWRTVSKRAIAIVHAANGRPIAASAAASA